MPKKILIIGGGGYIGSTLTMDFLSEGHKVVCLDLLVYGNTNGVLPFLGHKNFKFIYGNMGDNSILKRALDGVTDVLLLAGLVGDPITKKYPEESLTINQKGVLNVINSINGSGIKKLIFVSTCSNYGLINDHEVADENFKLNPLSLYAKAKVKAEEYLMSLQSQVDFSPVILRFATAFGVSPRMRFDLSISEFTYDLVTGKELIVFDPHTWRPYCHVRDFGRLIKLVLSAEDDLVSFNIFNAGGDKNNFTKDGIIQKILSFHPSGKLKYQKHGSDPRNYRVNFDKVKNVLGFTPRYSVEDGVREVIDSVKSRVFDDVDKNRNKYGNYEILQNVKRIL